MNRRQIITGLLGSTALALPDVTQAAWPEERFAEGGSIWCFLTRNFSPYETLRDIGVNFDWDLHQYHQLTTRVLAEGETSLDGRYDEYGFYIYGIPGAEQENIQLVDRFMEDLHLRKTIRYLHSWHGLEDPGAYANQMFITATQRAWDLWNSPEPFPSY